MRATRESSRACTSAARRDITRDARGKIRTGAKISVENLLHFLGGFVKLRPVELEPLSEQRWQDVFFHVHGRKCNG